MTLTNLSFLNGEDAKQIAIQKTDGS